MATMHSNPLRDPPAAARSRQSAFVGQKLGTFVASENAADLSALRELIEAGTLTPAVDRTYPLTGVAAAIRHLLDGQARGKLVVSVVPNTTPTPDAGSAA
jgi:NADPH:quinone reductase-like Zn-dependent oxidoreductase